MTIYIWFLAIAVVFTAFGYWRGMNASIQDTIEDTIDSLIEEGYLKTRKTNDEIILLKWHEWEN
jgi:hypothetical protein